MEVAQHRVHWWLILAVDVLKLMIQLPESNCDVIVHLNTKDSSVYCDECQQT
jgi:hypothetical protein